jgi:phosphoribosylaminoimidazole-succinocarboxamide synthase
MSEPRVIVESDIPGLKRINRGKVRDIYEMGDNLLLVATDRISAFDSILPTGIPRKGQVLTQMTLFWLDLLKDVTANHLITADVDQMGDAVKAKADDLRGRTMLVKKAKVFPIECVVRGYLAGSGWKNYKADGTVCGIKLPKGLRESDKLPEVLFAPATKAESGHDENIPFDRMVEIIGKEDATALRDKSIELYSRAEEYARGRGIIICDTKFEWGLVDGEVTLIDEVLTPDSSRFWPADQYKPGGPQPSFDKQFVRDWLEESGWDKEPPAPPLPDDVAHKTSEKYVQAYESLTGQRLY